MGMKTKRNSFRPKRCFDSAPTPSITKLSPPAHGSFPVIAYAVRLGSVVSTLHPLIFSLPGRHPASSYEKTCRPCGWSADANSHVHDAISRLNRPHCFFSTGRPQRMQTALQTQTRPVCKTRPGASSPHRLVRMARASLPVAFAACSWARCISGFPCHSVLRESTGGTSA